MDISTALEVGTERGEDVLLETDVGKTDVLVVGVGFDSGEDVVLVLETDVERTGVLMTGVVIALELGGGP